MKLINADLVVHWEAYDDEHESFTRHSDTIAEFLDQMTDEGCPELANESERESYKRGFEAGRKVVKPWKWTPCSEEMPQKDERYIVTVRDRFDNIKVQFRHWNADCNLWSGDQMDDVLAWCEIPEPWEGAQDGV